MSPDDFERVNGFLWPRRDRECRKVVFDWATDLNVVFQYIRSWDVCIQAGGNCGVWPKALSKRFGAVYTFEPDAENFWCLAQNCPESNIIKFQAALGERERPISLAGDRANCGALYVDSDGIIPVLSIDSLGLQKCGLIYLDIEGFEPYALRGARETIEAFRPVIAIENKGHSQRYGLTKEQVESFVESLGYRAVERPHRDVIFVHASHLR